MLPRTREYGSQPVPAVPVMPVLAPGRHASPSEGGCFMEIASLLAGEPWSDYPRSTDPVLALLARAVNDYVSDAGRRALVPMIPAVVGTSVSDPRTPIQLVRLVADYALVRGTGTHAQKLRQSAAMVARLRIPEPGAYGLWARVQRRRCRAKARTLARPVVGCAVADLSSLESAKADATLTQLLRDAIVTARQVSHPDGPSLVEAAAGLSDAARQVGRVGGGLDNVATPSVP